LCNKSLGALVVQNNIKSLGVLVVQNNIKSLGALVVQIQTILVPWWFEREPVQKMGSVRSVPKRYQTGIKRKESYRKICGGPGGLWVYRPAIGF
jgi:hypothetical protein